jgi:hypothetical protein
MGRVYALDPDISKGERSAISYGVRAFCQSAGERQYRFVSRVEFDADVDEGLATITATMTDDSGEPVINFVDNVATKIVFRGYCRIRHKDGSSLVAGGPSHDPKYYVDAEGNIWDAAQKPVAEMLVALEGK